jgi:hypothetical protein
MFTGLLAGVRRGRGWLGAVALTLACAQGPDTICQERSRFAWTGGDWELADSEIHAAPCEEVVFVNDSFSPVTITAVGHTGPLPPNWDWGTRPACAELAIGVLDAGSRRRVGMPQRDYCRVCAQSSESPDVRCLDLSICAGAGDGCPCGKTFGPYCD